MLASIVNSLLIAIFAAALAANPPAAVTNLPRQTNAVAAANDPVEKEYQKLVADDDEAQAEVDKWIEDNNAFAAKGAGVPQEELNRRIKDKFAPIRKRYEEFVNAHPNHA